MGQKKKLGKTRLDKFYYLAKEQGAQVAGDGARREGGSEMHAIALPCFRSRAAFKLIQLNRKYDFLSSSRSCLDLCAAPGGWLQVAVKNMPVGSLVLGVDLVPIRPVRGARTLIGDITTTETRAMLRREAAGALFDVVLHDGAPNVGGAWASEAYSQSALALEALRLASDTLAPRGTFVTKVFRSKDYTPLMYAMKQLFRSVEATKPAASRSTSAEIFVVCQGYKAPARIDPRLLDPKHLFKDVAEAPRNAGPDALVKQKVTQRRFREGYEDGLSSLHRTLPAADFVLLDAPIELLGKYTVLDLGAEAGAGGEGEGRELARFVADHPATTPEVRLLCGDLQVLGRSEFKQLLKWRLTLKRDLAKRAPAAAEAGASVKGAEDGKTAEDEEEDAETRLLREMGEIKDRMERVAKKEKKKRKELRMKARLRSAQMAEAEGIGEDNGPESMFSLASIKGSRQAVERLAAAGVPDAEDLDSGSEAGDVAEDPGTESEVDSEDEQRRYDAVMDEYLETSYQSWKERQRIRGKGGAARKRRRRVGMEGDLSEEEEEGADAGDEPVVLGGYSDDDDDDDTPGDGGGLVVELDESKVGVATSAAAAAAQWFSQDIFADADISAAAEGDDAGGASGDMSGVEAAPAPAPGVKKAGQQRAAVPAAPEPSDADPEPLTGGRSGGASRAGFEEATMMALAKKMLRRRVKDDIVEAAYNRYAFHDTGLPKWFEEDEKKFMRPAPQVTPAEYKEAREALRSVDARPMRKVAEAKARKAKRLGERLSQARQKAEAIAKSEDGSAGAKGI
ncbi:AdoMet-dependent rRNA methyltransferase spb1 [Auxenochlorella protothecoides]|uniref:AdoMet-dependent rRNA methyltransferase spb1 n=1 Tax=Auxenochlorella protothecoides TaxID=3075 RepID=A0A087SQ94_AUXPR|nr:AdoMet-dependent rRNA methyltransferase spb1 [Auxenochlorella protothecoides]KFM27898.1 AdoMet-dependent rRNA methyltransferase spb1 [Auxenochlorella protothecoides]